MELEDAFGLQALVLGYWGLVGAALGSFVNVVVVRLPEGRSVVRPGSRCPRCKQRIAWYDNIPLLSYLLLRGRCRACGAPISPRYLLGEVLMGALAMALWSRFGPAWDFALWLVLGAALLAITFLDLDHWWIPDVITLPGMALAFAASFLPREPGPLLALLGLAPSAFLWAIGFAFKRLLRREGLGLGDVKLLALLGLALGPMPTLALLLLASIQGSVLGGLYLLLGKGKDPKEHPAERAPGASGEDDATAEESEWVPHPRAIPFGPFLALAAFEIVLMPSLFADLPAVIVGLAVEGMG